MNAAYIDSSLLIALRFPDPDVAKVSAENLKAYQIYSSNLLEAEVRAFYWRNKVPFHASALAGIQWVMPRRALKPEFAEVLAAGYLRGADLWHVATALYLRRDSPGLSFATLDARQGEVAAVLGFEVVGQIGRTGK